MSATYYLIVFGAEVIQKEASWKPSSDNDCTTEYGLKELRNDILSHFFVGLNYDGSAAKPQNNGLLRKKNTTGVILEQTGTRMAEDGED